MLLVFAFRYLADGGFSPIVEGLVGEGAASAYRWLVLVW